LANGTVVDVDDDAVAVVVIGYSIVHCLVIPSLLTEYTDISLVSV
jgi:hypothetical protein